MNLYTVLFINAVAVFVVMTYWFMLAKLKKRIDIVDIGWGTGFITLAISTFVQAPNIYTTIILVLVIIWGLRLVSHILVRNHRKPDDPRYIEMTKNWNKRWYWPRAYVSIFLLQGLCILLIGLPITLASLTHQANLTTLAYVGIGIWVVGFLVETFSDWQLRRFVVRRKEHQIMDRGLWHYSRHPNYFGEIVQWFGIAAIVYTAPSQWIAWFGPLFLAYLIIFVSGIPPIENRRKNDPDYSEYRRRTSPLIPWPPKRARVKS